MKKITIALFLIVLYSTTAYPQKEPASYGPWIWPSEPPEDCPFELSDDLVGVALTKNYRHYLRKGGSYADTWYPTWAANDTLYSPWTDGACPRLDGTLDYSQSGYMQYRKEMVYLNNREHNIPLQATTGQAVMVGKDPLDLKIHSLGTFNGDPAPYQGRYPCGSLVYNGVWYYGTYCLAPAGTANIGGFDYNWPWLGPLVGFRTSTDYGIIWEDSPHTPEDPLFGETGMWGHPVKIGAPHFVDFGKNMEYSPDGKAYLVGMGAEVNDPAPRNANLSWISGDQIYLCRVTPSIENINDMSKYEFFSGYDDKGNPLWTSDFNQIRPLVDWNNNCGCVTMTYNPPLKKYILTITDGWPTVAKMNSYILESDDITGPWKLVTYMSDFGEQAYFLNFPSKFISDDGHTMWLCYSGNFATGWNDIKIRSDPPGSGYGLVMQEMILLDKRSVKKYKDNPRPVITNVERFRKKEDLIGYLKNLGNGSYLFGQIATWVHNANPDMDHSENWLRKVYDHTGKWPKYGCVTYDFDDNPYTDKEWNLAVRKMWSRGLIPGIYGWFANPSGSKFSDHCDIDQIFAQGSNPVKSSWYEQLDRMASNLKWLENEGIPVIYTPFVELDNQGKWFGTDGKENAIKLHRMIHDYFEQEKGLNNIIWAYHTGSNGRMKEFYPGDDYVDVMGHSVYHRWGNPPLDFFDYEWAVDKKKSKGKVIWIAELGINSQGEPPRDCFDVLKRLEEDYPELAGFVFWSGDAYYNVIGNANGTEFMADPRIVILE